ncbi:MAG TPA: di-heme oxidoredictase family protein, partial [Planctomycetota bacterium]|nr:di-heme oxidoredictase family protein [Planctomycetota bacterium]
RSGGGGDNVANVFVLAQALPYVNFDGGEGDNFENWNLDNVGNERNTPGMWGSGFIELLAREITAELHAIRDALVSQATTFGITTGTNLIAKGINYGYLESAPNGVLNTAGVLGIDADLIVRPFHQKGVVVSLREFTNNAMNHHHGIQSRERFGAGIDADGDGKADELTEGDITAATLWQAMLAVPGSVRPTDAQALADVQAGEALFEGVLGAGGIGCASCHVPSITLNDPIFTEPNPYNPAGNLRVGEVGALVTVDLTTEGDGPRPARTGNGQVIVRAYTDLKRHDMGPEMAEPKIQGGVPQSHFLTKKLWGFASEPPFMHHGRAYTITEAIEMHGGDAAASRQAFRNLTQQDKDRVLAFLKTLQVLPESATSLEITAPFSGITGEEPTVLNHLDQNDINSGLLTPAMLSQLGAHLFSASFNTLDGAGRPESTGTGQPRQRREAPQNVNRLSGLDANSCAGCHNQLAPGGGGDNVANVFVLAQAKPFINFDGLEGDGFATFDLKSAGNERNTPGMWGSGFIELLAREMTAELHAARDLLIPAAQTSGLPQSVALMSKGVSFGTLTALPSGALDTSLVVGVDGDLIIKPFHQKGVVVSLREFTNNAMNHHHGMQSAERFGLGADPDNDGVVNELSVGDITAATLFQSLLPVPLPTQPADPVAQEFAARGAILFRETLANGGMDCASCHVPELVLEDPVFSEPSPYNPAGNLQLSEVPTPLMVDLTTEGALPRLQRETNGTVRVPAYTDLKRHDMGVENAEPLVQGGVSTREFLTRKLWGFASEPPFMHHGRATTITEAILMHGGEGAPSRTAFQAASDADRAALVEFLKTLQVSPWSAPLPN